MKATFRRPRCLCVRAFASWPAASLPAVSMLTSAIDAAEFHVAMNGSDANTGTREDAEEIAAARIPAQLEP